jgi:hypothetical protein
VVAVAYSVAQVFERCDQFLNDEVRIRLWFHLADVPSDGRIDSWGTVFPELIDRVYGVHAFSWKFFLRSCLSSIIATLLFALIYGRIVLPHLLDTSEISDTFLYGAAFTLVYVILALAFN